MRTRLLRLWQAALPYVLPALCLGAAVAQEVLRRAALSLAFLLLLPAAAVVWLFEQADAALRDWGERLACAGNLWSADELEAERQEEERDRAERESLAPYFNYLDANPVPPEATKAILERTGNPWLDLPPETRQAILLEDFYTMNPGKRP